MEVSNTASTSYDEVLYPSGIFPQTHPDRLATRAYLRGMAPAPLECCRVLELGCGAANNLVTMAFHLPGSEFVGIDLGRTPIASGQALVAELGMRNVILQAMDIGDSSLNQFGEFDFIIAHGVYSWVPQPVRQRILEICRNMLTPQGIAYISYNAYPGCHFRDLVRHMMCFHTQNFEGAAEKATQARALVKFMAESRLKPDYYTQAFHAQLERLAKYSDESLYHDDLNPLAQPFYFHDFMEDAARHGLQYIGEAVLDNSDRALFTPEVLQRMGELEGANEIVREQYKDFLCGTGFRHTLLCRKEIRLAPAFVEERIPELFAMCDSVPVTDPEAAENTPVEFKSPRGGKVEITHPLWRTGLSYICSQWPCAVSFEQILEKVRGTKRIMDSDAATEAAIIVGALIQSYAAGVVSLRIRPPKVVNRISEQPAISQLARVQLRQGRSVASPLHHSVKIPDFAGKHFMSLLDGTRDLEKLSAEMLAFTESHVLNSQEGETLEKGTLEADVRQRVESNLESFRRAGILVS